MENFVTLLIPALMAVFLLRILLMPIRMVFKLLLHSGCGFACLWLLNTAAPFTGILLPMNAVTVFTAGALGLPGVGIVVLLAVL